MRTAARKLALAAAALASALATPCAADASGEDMQLSLTEIGAGKSAADNGLSVSGALGRYDRIAAQSVSMMLALSGQPGPDAANQKILTSELLLKTEGASAVVDTMPGSVPVDDIENRQAYSFAISATGPVAQAAIAACNGLATGERTSARTLSVNLAVTWRVTTGRFNFKWTNYDRVAPSGDIVNNRDFYSDQQTALVEEVIATPVVCQPLADAPAVAKAPAQTVVQTAYAAPQVAAPAVAPKPAAAQPVEPAPVTTASIDGGKGKPQCDGGMVRQLSGASDSYLCLCPGNTERIATGENAFSCEKRIRRR